MRVERLARALIIRRGGDDSDPYEWVDALSEAQMRLDLNMLRQMVEQFLTK